MDVRKIHWMKNEEALGIGWALDLLKELCFGNIVMAIDCQEISNWLCLAINRKSASGVENCLENLAFKLKEKNRRGTVLYRNITTNVVVFS
ncbi:hypothetical protein RJT34_15498 [Clitoria ternatea]|uniref:Uncharacterized protein n=1 Tax=Clitoria ternatea TaxID=43366 RepID=A0AAN9J5J3_CLITE